MSKSRAFTVTITLAAALIGTLFSTAFSLSLPTPRFLGGTSAKPGQFPWTVSIQTNNTGEGNNSFEHECGGAILTKSTVVTAAHCVWNRTASNMMIVAGAHNIKKMEESQQRKGVSEMTMHPKYEPGTDVGPYDVAVIRLATPLTFNERVRSIKMAKKKERPKGTCQNSGWGNLFPITPVQYKGSDVLVTSKTNIVNMEYCKTAYMMGEEKLATAICASAEPLQGTCQGDSGGPLTCYRKNSSPYLAGLVSFGFQVCNNGVHPDVYSDLGNSEIFNFIRSHPAVQKHSKTKDKTKDKGGSNNSTQSVTAQIPGAQRTSAQSQKRVLGIV